MAAVEVEVERDSVGTVARQRTAEAERSAVGGASGPVAVVHKSASDRRAQAVGRQAAGLHTAPGTEARNRRRWDRQLAQLLRPSSFFRRNKDILWRTAKRRARTPGRSS